MSLNPPDSLFGDEFRGDHGAPGRPATADDVLDAPLPRVKVIRSAKRFKTVSARLVDGVIEVRIPDWLSEREEDELVADTIQRCEEKWRCSRVSLADRARALAARFDLPEPRSIRWSTRQNFRWGSCTTQRGDIRISSRLVQAPRWVLDHVIVHELAHLVEPNHGPRFQALLRRNPDADRAEGYLQAMADLAHLPEPPSALAG